MRGATYRYGNGFFVEMTTQRTVIILGNGQLGLMLGKAAKKLGIPFSALSIPAAWDWLQNSPDSQALVSFEQEHVDETLLSAFRAAGIESFPSWESFLLLKSKLAQKRFLQKSGLPSSPFLSVSPWSNAADQFLLQNGGAVLKAGKGGYDGKGVWLVGADGRTKDGSAKEVAAKLIDPYLEAKVDFDTEAAVVVCRSSSGQMELYPTVRSVQRDGICYQVEYSHEFAAKKQSKQAGEIARAIAEKLEYVGTLAVECFFRGEEVLVNEIAPRVHNSGHFTIDVCAGSQFENHLRAGLALPLARSVPTSPAALMVNLLWPEGHEFAPLYTKLSCGPEWPENAKLHWYGKSEARPNRKMGHFTVYGATLQECHILADQILASRWA
jgi:5-(carboxyamino)imidazole ribonucleotide synthase